MSERLSRAMSERLCECTDPDRPLFIWRGDPTWWSCFYCDLRVRPLTQEELKARG